MRPRKSPLARIAGLLSIPPEFLQSTLDEWPSNTALLKPCLEGPQLVWHDGRTQPTVRVLFELIYGEPMHPTWKLKRLCHNPECRTPHHWQPEMIFRVDGTVTVPLPSRTWDIRGITSFADLPTDPEEVIDTVLGIEGGRQMTPEQLWEYTERNYEIEDFAAALERIRAEGL